MTESAPPSKIGPSTTINLGLAITVLISILGMGWKIFGVTGSLAMHVAVVEERLTSMDRNLSQLATSSSTSGRVMSDHSSRITVIEHDLAEIRRRLGALEK